MRVLIVEDTPDETEAGHDARGEWTAMTRGEEENLSRLGRILALALLMTVGASDATGQAPHEVAATPSPALVGTPVTVTVTRSGPGCPEPVTIAFGDGSSIQVVQAISTLRVTHTYTRAGTFSITATTPTPCPGTATTTLLVSTAATVPFSLRRVEVLFDNGRGEITVPRDGQLHARADILFNGTGLLIAAWEVDGQTQAIIHESLAFGARATFTTPELPPLPTFEPGRHELTFRVLQPPLTFRVPPITYYVTDR